MKIEKENLLPYLHLDSIDTISKAFLSSPSNSEKSKFWASKIIFFLSAPFTFQKKATMSASSNFVKQVEQVIQNKNQKPEWLEAFLQRTYFGSCSLHPIRRNEKNRYCINCDSSACQYCMTSTTHRHHKILKIYRHVYKDVVSLGAMEKYIDCAEIQPYKCNKRLVIALNPLPHGGPTLNAETSCEICKRRLAEPDLYRYCSISCKVIAFERKSSDLAPPFLSLQSLNKVAKRKKPLKIEQPQHKRKGKPQRAPFF